MPNPNMRKGAPSVNPGGRPKSHDVRALLASYYGADGKGIIDKARDLREKAMARRDYKLAFDIDRWEMAYLKGTPTQTVDIGQNPDREPVRLVVVRNGVSGHRG